MTAGTIRPAAALLRRAARGYRDGSIAWGRERLIDDDGRRCLVAAVCWAADPNDLYSGGNPFSLYDPQARASAAMALAAVAEHLTCELGWPWTEDGVDEPNLIDTVGDWQDHSRRTVLDVIRLCETVAEVLWPAALAGAR